VWLAVRAGLRDVLDNLTVADLANGKPPARVTRRAIPDPRP